MTIKRITENPKTTDTILLEIQTPDINGCFLHDPYKIDNVIIYYVERDFLGKNYGHYEKRTVNESLKLKLKKSIEEACNNPTQENITKLDRIKAEIESSSQKSDIFFKERTTIKIIGNEEFPAWLSTDVNNSTLKKVEFDEIGNSQFGHFSYEWTPKGSIREGDYFVCWTYTLLAAGDKLSQHIHFKIDGDTKSVTSMPMHQTIDGKYELLLEKYTPEMYKLTLSDHDVTPQVIEKLNKSVAQGFTFVEDMANQVIDLFDANSLHESMLQYLSNNFALKLRSDDPTLWRRQIKEAVPLFKKKGTLQGLKEAFEQAGMTLNDFIQYWQVTSPFTMTESFKVKDSPTFKLSKNQVYFPIDTDYCKLWIKREGEDSYNEIPIDNIEFTEDVEGNAQINWIGDIISSGNIEIFEGDYIKIMYQFKAFSDSNDQIIENYIQTLPLMDGRNENDQEFPPKNWNVRLIDESDPLFSNLVPTRQPFYDPIVFGHVRTEFAYSENIYNADEYNGSIRPSTNPCNIDKNFVDDCGSCLSSSYSVDVSIEEISNDRIEEAKDIIREFTPFNSSLHSIGFNGDVTEFFQDPIETIDVLITYDFTENVISGMANPIFTRNMPDESEYIISREDLADQVTILSGKMGTAYNDQITFISPDTNLHDLGIIIGSNILEILSPSPNAGLYELDDINNYMAKVVSSVDEPLYEGAFTYRLSNTTYENNTTSIEQKDLVKLTDDETIDFSDYNIISQWDIENNSSITENVWKVLIPSISSTPYEIKHVIGKKLIIDVNSTSVAVDVNFTLINSQGIPVKSSNTGKIQVNKYGHVYLNDPLVHSHLELATDGDYIVYNGVEYEITDVDHEYFIIKDYVSGNIMGANITIRRRLLENSVGYFGYEGLILNTFFDHEAEFNMANGSNPPPEDCIGDDSKFKENFLIKIGNDFYKILSIDKTKIVLSGKHQSWTTLSNGGTAVPYSVVHLPKTPITVGVTLFDHIDRDGQDPVILEIESIIDPDQVIVALSAPSDSGYQDNVEQSEGVSFIIETKDGKTIEGEM